MTEEIECCKYCIFFRLKDNFSGRNLGHGECRVDSPVIYGKYGASGWPVITETDWCGSFNGNKEWDRLTEERKPKGHFESTQEMIRKYKETL